MPRSYPDILKAKRVRYLARKRCPVCERPGSGPYTKKIKGREYVYFVHSMKNPETGRYCQKWHCVGPASAIEQAGGIPAYLEAIRSRSHIALQH